MSGGKVPHKLYARTTWPASKQMLPPLQRPDPECFTVFCQKHNSKVSSTRTTVKQVHYKFHTAWGYSCGEQGSPTPHRPAYTRHAFMGSVKGEAGSMLPVTSVCLEQVMITEFSCSLFPAQFWADFSGVIFMCGRSWKGQTHPAQLLLLWMLWQHYWGQKECYAAALSHLHQAVGFAVPLSASLAH